MTTFSPEALYAALDRKRRARGMCWRDVAWAAGVTPSLFTRIGRHGLRPDVDNLARLLAWLGDTDIRPYIITIEEDDQL